MLITTDSFAEGGGLARSSLLDNQNMAQAIVRDPGIMHGTPFFRGTRVPAQTLFDFFEGGETLEDFLEGFPTLQVLACG